MHRPLCNVVSAKEWKWVEIAVQRPSVFNLNRYEVVGHPELYMRSLEYLNPAPPENVHGTLPFIVKIQLAAADASNLPEAIGQQVDPRERDGQSVLIYDRQQSVEFALEKGRADPEDFGVIAQLVRANGFRGLRLFCWAVRSGDWTLRICSDHFPEEQKW
jgi:hypothetical protein